MYILHYSCICEVHMYVHICMYVDNTQMHCMPIVQIRQGNLQLLSIMLDIM